MREEKKLRTHTQKPSIRIFHYMPAPNKYIQQLSVSASVCDTRKCACVYVYVQGDRERAVCKKPHSQANNKQTNKNEQSRLLAKIYR